MLVEDMRIGLIYPSEDVAVDAILKWGEKALCPLAKARRTKTLAESGGKTRGHRCLDCPHSRSRKKGENEIRQKQRYKFTKCPVSIVINENGRYPRLLLSTLATKFHRRIIMCMSIPRG